MPRRPDFEKLRAALRQLDLNQARQLYAELGTIVQELEAQSNTSTPVQAKSREVLEVKHLSVGGSSPPETRLYQLELVRCGKDGCKCAGDNGELHGPYWYAYWRHDGKLKSRYVGKRLREIE